jgi:hypothetical protein
MCFLKTFVLILGIFFFSNKAFSENINKIFHSPNKINKIEYEGMDRYGVGTLYNNYKHNDNKILTVEIGALAPQINWYGDYIAEINIYLGPGFHRSYFYLYKYDKLTPLINQVILVIPDKEIIFNCDDWVHINIRSLVSNKILQIIELEGINGISLGSKNLFKNVNITKDEILLWNDIEPYTYKTLEVPVLYRFRRMF